jgi:hypothetical protein
LGNYRFECSLYTRIAAAHDFAIRFYNGLGSYFGFLPEQSSKVFFNPMRVEFPAACSVINKVWVLIPRQLAAG